MTVSRRVSILIVVAAMLSALSCETADDAQPGQPPGTIGLVRLEAATGAPAPATGAGEGKLLPMTGWEAGQGVAELKSTGGRITGRATSDYPIIHLSWSEAPTDADSLHSIKVRLRVSAGKEISIGFSGQKEKFDLRKECQETKAFPFQTKGTLQPGDEVREIEILPPLSRTASSLRHILLRPTDQPGATFEIESIRAVLREDYLESIPSGVSWQGLSEVYHEAIVSRAPEVMRYTIALPEHPWLDLSIGTVEDSPVTFVVTAAVGDRAGDAAASANGGASGSNAARSNPLLERTITRAHRWEPAPIDLSEFGGKTITLSLALVSDTQSSNAHAARKRGEIGMWGSPVVRDRGVVAQERGSSARGSDRKPGASDSGKAPQGVILIWADTLRRDHLEAYGYDRPTSPAIAAFAREGTTFEDCLGQATWTKVATPSMMSSLYPLTNGVHDFWDRLPASTTTLAEVYRDAGYATVSYSSILFTGQMSNLHQGFEEVHESGSLADENSSKTAREYVDRLLPWLDAHKDGPFFVFLHISDPHDPFKPYAPYDTMFNDGSKTAEHEKQMEDVRKFIEDPLMKNFVMPTRAELARAGFDPDAYTQFNEDWYDGSIRGMDAEIGRLMERLRTLGLDDRTLVVFTGDHGEEFLDHGKSFHGQSVYGELNDVSLIFHQPGRVPSGARVRETVESIDIAPTLLAMSGLAVPDEAQGESLVPLIDSTAGWTARPAMSEKSITEPGGAPPPHDTESYAIVDGGWRLIRNTARHEGAAEFELYDEARDPLNQKDVASLHAGIVERLAKELDDWKAKATAARIAPDADTSRTLKPEDLERLRSLGYVK